MNYVFKNKEKRNCSDFIAYSVFFLIIAGIVVSVFTIHNKSFVHMGDPFDQDFPIFLYLGKRLRALLQGNFYLYDFTVGLGENTISPLNLYGLGDPLNLFAIFAFPENAVLIYTALLFARMYLAGFGMVSFLRYHNYHGRLTAVAGAAYAFSWFSVVRGLYFYSLLSTMYLFPFLMIQLEKMIRNRKIQYGIAVKFAILIAIQASCSFYFLYMQTIFLFSYGLYVYFQINGTKDVGRKLPVQIGRIAIFYLLGILLSGFVLFTTIRDFLCSSRNAVGIAQNSRLFFSWKELALWFSDLLIPMTSDENYGLALPCICLIAVVLFLFSHKKNRKEKILFCLLMAAYLCPFFWSMTNGFSYESDRWTYVLYFWVICITIDVLEEYLEKGCAGIGLGIATALAVLSIGYHFVLNGDKIRSFAYLLLALTIGYIMVKNKRNIRWITSLIFVSVFANVFFLVAPWQICGHDIWQNFCDTAKVQQLADRMSQKDPEDEFYRLDKKPVSRADSIVAGYNGTTEYFSILNKNTFEFWKKLMISPGICAEPHHLEGLDGRKTLEALMCVREFEDGDKVVQNDWTLPLGVQYTQTISESEFEKLTPLQRQHAILSYMVLEEEASNGKVMEWTPLELDYQKEWRNIEWQGDKFIPEKDGELLLTLDTTPVDVKNGELYVSFSKFQCYQNDFVALDVGEKELLVQNPTSKYFTGMTDYLVHTSCTEEGKVIISFPPGNEYSLEDIRVYWYDYNGMEEAVRELQSNSLQNLCIQNDHISGNIDAKEGWLFFSIPYSRDWTARVDGEKVTIHKANVGFMAIGLESGEHYVELEYRPIGTIAGGICSMIACVIIIVLGVRQIYESGYFSRRKGNQNQ